jgi:site-specific recombinase XerD
VLRAYWHAARPPGDYLFQGTKAGQPISRKAVWHMLRKVAARCGLTKRISPHTLRHHADSRIMPTRRAIAPWVALELLPKSA